MRRNAALLLLIAVCLLTGLSAALAEGQDADVNNPNPADRLNLREKPEKSADSLGRYYNGARVQIIGDAGPEWVRVRIGYADSGYQEGYMMRSYLAFGDAAASVGPAMPMMRCLSSGGFAMRLKPSGSSGRVCYSSSGEASLSVRTAITVLGDLSGGWVHVSVEASDAGHARADENGVVRFTGFVQKERLALISDSAGVTTRAAVAYDKNQKHPYSEAELNGAAALILARFDERYDGCVLTRLWYDEARSDEILAADPGKGGFPEWIVFLSDFDTFPGSEEGGFEPNGTYEGWMWFLRRDDRESPWEIVDWGLY